MFIVYLILGGLMLLYLLIAMMINTHDIQYKKKNDWLRQVIKKTDIFIIRILIF